MNQARKPVKPRPAKAKSKKRPVKKTNAADWLTNYWTWVVVAGLTLLVAIVIIAASFSDNSGGESGDLAEPRPDSSGPIAVGDLEFNIHQWDCGRMVFESLGNPDETIAAADGSHFCALGIKVSNLNTEKLRAFEPAGQQVSFGGQSYRYHAEATRNGLGAKTGTQILPAGIGVNPGTVPPLINMVFEIPKDPEDGSLSWRNDARLMTPVDSPDGEEAFLDIELRDYDKQS